jgi:hypothetical protein
MSGQRMLFVWVSLGIILLSVLSVSLGYKRTLRLWNVEASSPCFADFRGITSGAESRALGYDPLLYNPRDPYRRTLNYPRIWQMLYRVGLNQSHTIICAWTVIALFVVGIFLYTPATIAGVTSVILAVCIFSPAVLLGVELGNIDLLMFFLLSLAIFCVNRDVARAKVFALGFLLMAFILKLFPIFGAGLILNQTKKVVMRMGLWLAVIACVYLLATFMDLVWIRYATAECLELSYGLNVLWLKVGAHIPAGLAITKWLSYAAVGIFSALAVWGLASQKFGQWENYDSDPRTLDAFRAGCGIYIGTFLLIINNEYRLIFLLLVIPQLAFWANSCSGGISKVSVLVIMAIIFLMWHSVIDPFLSLLHFGFWGGLLYILSSWLAFGGLLFLFACSLPVWVKNATKNLFSMKNRSALAG